MFHNLVKKYDLYDFNSSNEIFVVIRTKINKVIKIMEIQRPLLVSRKCSQQTSISLLFLFGMCNDYIIPGYIIPDAGGSRVEKNANWMARKGGKGEYVYRDSGWRLKRGWWSLERDQPTNAPLCFSRESRMTFIAKLEIPLAISQLGHWAMVYIFVPRSIKVLCFTSIPLSLSNVVYRNRS